MQPYNILQAPLQQQQSPSPTKRTLLIQIKQQQNSNQSKKEELSHLCSLLSQSKQSLLSDILASLKVKSATAQETQPSQNQESRLWLEKASHILEQLKQNKPHSAPFLMRVNKREAPDYFDIIKEPMDLGTMARKLRQRQYQSRADFQYDLELIWSNCMFYNSDPRSVYREHATLMKKMADQMLESLPELLLPANGSIAADDYNDEDDSQTSQAGDVEMKSNSNQASVDLLASSLTRFENFGVNQQQSVDANEDQILMEVDNVAEDDDDLPNELIKNLQQKLFAQFQAQSLERTAFGMLDYEIHRQLNTLEFWPELTHFCNSYPDVSLPIDVDQDVTLVEYIQPSGLYGETINLSRYCQILQSQVEHLLSQRIQQKSVEQQVIQEQSQSDTRVPNIADSNRRSLAYLTGRVGFTGSSQSALELLDDVYKQYITKLGQQLRKRGDVYSRVNQTRADGIKILDCLLSFDASVSPQELYKFISVPNQRHLKLIKVKEGLQLFSHRLQNEDDDAIRDLLSSWREQIEKPVDNAPVEDKYPPAADFDQVKSLDGIIGLMHPFIKAKLQNASVVFEESPLKQTKKGKSTNGNVKKQ